VGSQDIVSTKLVFFRRIESVFNISENSWVAELEDAIAIVIQERKTLKVTYGLSRSVKLLSYRFESCPNYKADNLVIDVWS